jgi:hypothetical protein
MVGRQWTTAVALGVLQGYPLSISFMEQNKDGGEEMHGEEDKREMLAVVPVK